MRLSRHAEAEESYEIYQQQNIQDKKVGDKVSHSSRRQRADKSWLCMKNNWRNIYIKDIYILCKKSLRVDERAQW